MSLGDAWATITPGSASKLNTTNVIWGTGAYLAGLDKTKHKIVVCTSTGSGLTVDHVYLASNDGTTWIDISTVGTHTHSSSTTGGGLIDIEIANPLVFDLSLTKTDDLKKAQWIETTTGTGSINDLTDGTTGERNIQLYTGATSGSGATISYPHLQLDFSKRSVYQVKVRPGDTTSMAFHSGVGADDVTAADSTTRKYNAEFCTATNTNWFLRSADGSTATTSDSGTAFTNTRTGIRIEHYPDLGTPRLDMYINTGTVFSKTTNIPTSSATADNNLIKHSLKNSAASARDTYIYASRLRYTISDQWT